MRIEVGDFLYPGTQILIFIFYSRFRWISEMLLTSQISYLTSINYLVAFFLLATVLRFPLRVRELFLVR